MVRAKKLQVETFIKRFNPFLCENCNQIIQNDIIEHCNKGTGITHKFCSKKCKLDWIFKKQKELNSQID